MLGDDITLMLDFGYRWSDWRAALWTLSASRTATSTSPRRRCSTTTSRATPGSPTRLETRVCGAEFAATRFECREWLDAARVDVLQPDINRCGGLTEMRRIAELAACHGARRDPARLEDRHHRRRRPALPRRDRATRRRSSSSRRALRLPAPPRARPPEPAIVDGRMDLPTGPGLGIELDEDAVARYRVDDLRPASA